MSSEGSAPEVSRARGEAAADAPAALLQVDDLRVDVGGVPSCDGLTLRTTGQRVVVLGAPHALFEAVTALRQVLRGAVAVRGAAPLEARRAGLLAGAASSREADALPPRWSATEYVTWSARLAGLGARPARRVAEEAIEWMQLGAMAKTPLARLLPHARRATVVASALATGAEIVALDDPLGGLPDETARTYAEVLVAGLAAALPRRAWLVFAPRLPLASPLAAAAEEVVVVTATQLEGQWAPAELARGGDVAARRYVARVVGPSGAHADATELARELERRGVGVVQRGARLHLDLGDRMSTGELMALCAAADVAVLELVPEAARFG